MANTNDLATVELSSVGNIDFGEAWKKGEMTPTIHKPVRTFREASLVCREYRDDHNLGGGNWSGGCIRFRGLPIAHVSYNGRVWWNSKSCDYDEVTDLDAEIVGASAKGGC